MPRRPLKIELQIRSPFPVRHAMAAKRAAKRAVESIPERVWKRTAAGRKTATLSLSVVRAKTIQNLNRVYRGKDRPTDVLSFPAAPMPGSDLLGDVVLCWSVAKDQTSLFHTTPQEEVERLVVHGVLHLFGYDHEISQKEERRMFRLQEAILSMLPPDRAGRLLRKGTTSPEKSKRTLRRKRTK